MAQMVEGIIGEKSIVLETGRLAKQANGAVTVQYGDTIVLVTVCCAKPTIQRDFFPLTVDYEEKLYAAGKIPGGFLRREGRPTQEAILAGRLIDRPLRPLFPKGFYYEVQIVATVISTDQENMCEVPAIIGASAALSISDIPFEGPVGAVRVGLTDGKFVVNPTFSELKNSDIDMVVVSTREAIVMVEAGASEVSEEIAMEAIKFGHQVNQEIIMLQDRLKEACGKPKLEFHAEETAPELESDVVGLLANQLDNMWGKDKTERDGIVGGIKQGIVDALAEKYSAQEIVAVIDSKIKKEVRSHVLEKRSRLDGRGPKDIRTIECEVGILPRSHGSGLFNRGLTQVLTITSLGSKSDEQMLDGLTLQERRRFMHHYNFPPFSVGEVKRLQTGRREIGHGALAERALAPIIPDSLDFPYTIRLVSEVLSSNGSTSMASVCGSTLSMMDAGVPIKAPVAGIAMGLMTNGVGDYIVLSDIEGKEDACGDMDFKVAGTNQGITALQLDTKLKGITIDMIWDTLEQAKEGRNFILGKMQEAILSSRSELSKYAPRIVKITIDTSKIGAVIGPGGKTIRAIIEETKATIDITDDGTVLVGSNNEEAASKAIAKIEALTRDVEVGGIYTGKVTRILNFGAFVEILPGKEGLVHISELAEYRVASVEDVVKSGDEITVMVIGIDQQGRVNLSRKAIFQGDSQTNKGK